MAMQRIQNSQITKLKDLLLGCQVFFKSVDPRQGKHRGL